jgi:hypothetical protein
MFKVFAITGLLAFSPLTFGNGDKLRPLSEFISEELEDQKNAFELYSEDEPLIYRRKWYLNKLRLRIRAKVGLSIPIFASFDIRPFVELHWKRSTPSNYMKYEEFIKSTWLMD